MKTTLKLYLISASFLATLVLDSCTSQPKSGYQPAPCTLSTKWTTLTGPGNVWPEYPRPQMARERWMILNGLWEYAITPKDAPAPVAFDGKILVPYPPESCLSGVGRIIQPSEKIWYHCTFRNDLKWKGERILLNFEASDWETTVWVNGKMVGAHRGGYDPFFFDITDAINDRGKQELLVSVWDPTDTGYQPRGKQVLEPEGIWYTPVSGIWQSVWLEPVSEAHVSNLTIVPDLDQGLFRVKVDVAGATTLDSLVIAIKEDPKTNRRFAGKPGEVLSVNMEKIHPWSPEDPYLYEIEVRLYQDGRMADKITSYAGLRKISLGKDGNGITRLMLNNEFVFQEGPLDQGFWPDGIYTPPTDEAMKYDLEVIKSIGFNMLRKHVKVENRRFYSWCDRMGILVWQDMPSGFKSNDTIPRTGEEMAQFETELSALVKTHCNNPSIVMWVPFNEGWGQYDTPRIVDLIRSLDSTRLVDNASGWSDTGAGDVIDWHHYPEPVCPMPEESRAAVLGEFGGLGYYVQGHTWQEENWGYKKMSSPQELSDKYSEFFNQVKAFKKDPGLSACIYTQITDVETETNGLMTYDRAVLKMDHDHLREVHKR